MNGGLEWREKGTFEWRGEWRVRVRGWGEGCIKGECTGEWAGGGDGVGVGYRLD